MPGDLDGAIVSNDFPVFDLNRDRLLPQYLGWLSRTGPFVEQCQRTSEGTTNRVRISENRFLAIEILLPRLSEKRRIVARIDELASKINEALSLRLVAKNQTDAFVVASLKSTILARQTRITTLEEVCETFIDNLHSNPQYADLGVPMCSVARRPMGNARP